MTDHWTQRLSQYVDGELPDAERRALERHVAGCGACRGALAGVQRVAQRGRALPDQAPEHDLWPGIAARIGVPARAARRRVSFTVTQLAAAATVLAIAAGAGALAISTFTQRTPDAPAPSLAAAPLWPATPHIDAAAARLELALAAGRGVLDSATVTVLERSLATIDSAIVEARAALAADPANGYLNHHLAGQMRRKLELLRRATALVAARS